MFRWGVTQELVPAAVADALKYVAPLRRGHTTAPESKPRRNVPNEIVDATLPHLLPTVAAMVQVQRWAVMRPNEVCRMLVGDIDMSRKDGIWLYKPALHKGAWLDHEKAVPFGKPEQKLLIPYLKGKSPTQAVFNPIVAALENVVGEATRRKTGKKQRSNKEYYTPQTYARAIKTAIKRANRSLPEDQQIPHWTPYQLRHAGVTELVLENDGDREIARAVAGQKSITITQGYNHADLKIAIEQAKKRGS
jgi:integrase